MFLFTFIITDQILACSDGLGGWLHGGYGSWCGRGRGRIYARDTVSCESFAHLTHTLRGWVRVTTYVHTGGIRHTRVPNIVRVRHPCTYYSLT
jgi:hypothetical protein